MSLLHRAWERRLGLLAADALAEAERPKVLAHLERCPRCRDEHGRLGAALALVAADPVRAAEPPLSLAALAARVMARLETPASRPVLRPWPASAAAAAVALAALAVFSRPRPSPPFPVDLEETAGDALLERMERSVRREQTARYLNEAQDVLVTVASPPQRCRRSRARVDVEEEARRSRELLARRALLLDLAEPEKAAAGPVLHEVEHVLRKVASLESCVRRGQLEALEREIARRRLLMRIDLATRELLG